MGSSFTRIGVVGAGTMGGGITEVLARTGFDVVTVEIDESVMSRSRERVEASTARAVARGKLTEDDRAALLGRVTWTTGLDQLADVDLVIEAVPEHLQLKEDIFGHLDKICSAGTVFATNTSSLSVTEIAVATSRPSRVVGLHWFNPAPVMGLVEIVRTVITDQAVIDRAAELAQACGKTPVVVGDRAGFIANALLMAYLNNAANMYAARYATREDIDAAMRLGCGLPMGPLALLDLIGLDTAYEILDTIYHETRDHLHAAAPVLKQLVTAGLLGRKSGRGFYTYDGPGSPTVVADEHTPGADGAAGTPAARPVSHIGVVGTGTMASGIVEVLAKAGYQVTYRARGAAKVEAVHKRISASLDKGVQRGKLTEGDREAALSRIKGTIELDDLADVDLVVEAVVEDLAVKRALFAALDEVCKPGAVLATTTSSLPVVEMAAATRRPADVVGMHWFNPAPVMRLVEVVQTVSTAADVLATVREVSRRAGKHPVDCGDRAGFIVNALLFPYLNDAIRMLETNYAGADEIDAAMKTGCGYPMGPFELLDVVGLDVTLAIQQTLYLEFREPGLALAPMLENLVRAGYLGRKTGRGFRIYGG